MEQYELNAAKRADIERWMREQHRVALARQYHKTDAHRPVVLLGALLVRVGRWLGAPPLKNSALG